MPDSVDVATHDAVAIEDERATSGAGELRSGTCVLDRLASTLGLPRVIRNGNGKAFRCKAMVVWTHGRRTGNRSNLFGDGPIRSPAVRRGSSSGNCDRRVPESASAGWSSRPEALRSTG